MVPARAGSGLAREGTSQEGQLGRRFKAGKSEVERGPGKASVGSSEEGLPGGPFAFPAHSSCHLPVLEGGIKELDLV